MECLKCGSETQEDARFCGQCGASLSVRQGANPPPHQMDASAPENTEVAPITAGAMVITQSHWSYMLYAIPWLIFFAVTLAVDFLSFGMLPALIAMYIIGSRYISFRKTAYILTDEHLIIFQGSLIGKRRIDIPLSDLDEILLQSGLFGRSLGYTGVRLQLTDTRVTFLHYVPRECPLLTHLWVRMNPDSPDGKEHGEKL